jgi:hypothetical protein
MVDVVATLDRDTFVANYLEKNKPVVVTDGLKIPASEKWNFRYFVDNFGSKEVKISLEDKDGNHKTIPSTLGFYIESFSRILFNSGAKTILM